MGLLFILWLQPLTGSLLLEAPPGASVRWEGFLLGEVSSTGKMLIEEIPPGSYRVEVSHPRAVIFSSQILVREGLQELVAGGPSPVASQPATGPAARAPMMSVPRTQPVPVSGSPRTSLISPEDSRESLPAELAEESRASSLSDPGASVSWPTIFSMIFGFAGLLWYWRRSLLGPEVSGATVKKFPAPNPEPTGPTILLAPSVSRRTPKGYQESEFLDDLRRREEVAEGRPPVRRHGERVGFEVFEIEGILQDDPGPSD